MLWMVYLAKRHVIKSKSFIQCLKTLVINFEWVCICVTAVLHHTVLSTHCVPCEFHIKFPVAIYLHQDEGSQSSTIHRRVERRWLGGIKIPFTTIYINGRVCVPL